MLIKVWWSTPCIANIYYQNNLGLWVKGLQQVWDALKILDAANVDNPEAVSDVYVLSACWSYWIVFCHLLISHSHHLQILVTCPMHKISYFYCVQSWNLLFESCLQKFSWKTRRMEQWVISICYCLVVSFLRSLITSSFISLVKIYSASGV